MEKPLTETGNTMEMAVVLEGYPYTLMTEEQAAELCRRLDSTTTREPVQFYSSRYESGAMIFICVNETTKKWLKDTVPEHIPCPKGRWEVGPGDIVVHGIKFMFSLKFNVNNMGTEQILKLIEQENEAISTREWNVVERSRSSLTVWVDIRTLNVLKASCLKLHLGKSKIEFKPVVNLNKMKLAGVQPIQTRITSGIASGLTPMPRLTKLAVVKPICQAESDKDVCATSDKGRYVNPEPPNAGDIKCEDSSLSQLLERVSKPYNSKTSHEGRAEDVAEPKTLSQFLESVAKLRTSTEPDRGSCADVQQQSLASASGFGMGVCGNLDLQASAGTGYENISLAQLLESVSKPFTSTESDKGWSVDPNLPTVGQRLTNLEPPVARNVSYKDSAACHVNYEKYENPYPPQLVQPKIVDATPSGSRNVMNVDSSALWTRRSCAPQVATESRKRTGMDPQPGTAVGKRLKDSDPPPYEERPYKDLDLSEFGKQMCQDLREQKSGDRGFKESFYPPFTERQFNRWAERDIDKGLGKDLESSPAGNSRFRDLAPPTVPEKHFMPWAKRDFDKDRREELDCPSSDDRFKDSGMFPFQRKHWAKKDFDEARREGLDRTTADEVRFKNSGTPTFPERQFKSWDPRKVDEGRFGKLEQHAPGSASFKDSDQLPFSKIQYKPSVKSELDKGLCEGPYHTPGSGTRLKDSRFPYLQEGYCKPWFKTEFDEGRSGGLDQHTSGETRLKDSGPERLYKSHNLWEVNKGKYENLDRTNSGVPRLTDGRLSKPWMRSVFSRSVREDIGEQKFGTTNIKLSTPRPLPQWRPKPWEDPEFDEETYEDLDESADQQAEVKDSDPPPFSDHQSKPSSKAEHGKAGCEDLDRLTTEEAMVKGSGTSPLPKPVGKTEFEKGRCGDLDQPTAGATIVEGTRPSLSPEMQSKPGDKSEFKKEKDGDLDEPTPGSVEASSQSSPKGQCKPRGKTEFEKGRHGDLDPPLTGGTLVEASRSLSSPERQSKPLDKTELDKEKHMDPLQPSVVETMVKGSRLPPLTQSQSESSVKTELDKVARKDVSKPTSIDKSFNKSDMPLFPEQQSEPFNSRACDDQPTASDSRFLNSGPLKYPEMQSKHFSSSEGYKVESEDLDQFTTGDMGFTHSGSTLSSDRVSKPSGSRECDKGENLTTQDTRFKDSRVLESTESISSGELETGIDRDRSEGLGQFTTVDSRHDYSNLPLFPDRQSQPQRSMEVNEMRTKYLDQTVSDMRHRDIGPPLSSERQFLSTSSSKIDEGWSECLDSPETRLRRFTYSDSPQIAATWSNFRGSANSDEGRRVEFDRQSTGGPQFHNSRHPQFVGQPGSWGSKELEPPNPPVAIMTRSEDSFLSHPAEAKRAYAELPWQHDRRTSPHWSRNSMFPESAPSPSRFVSSYPARHPEMGDPYPARHSEMGDPYPARHSEMGDRHFNAASSREPHYPGMSSAYPEEPWFSSSKYPPYY